MRHGVAALQVSVVEYQFLRVVEIPVLPKHFPTLQSAFPGRNILHHPTKNLPASQWLGVFVGVA